jgi:hypothetical protein
MIASMSPRLRRFRATAAAAGLLISIRSVKTTLASSVHSLPSQLLHCTTTVHSHCAADGGACAEEQEKAAETAAAAAAADMLASQCASPLSHGGCLNILINNERCQVRVAACQIACASCGTRLAYW